eukprot:COSAG02_NODE_29188_length_574_cov_0.960000_2_plen_29_part_01
MAVDTGRCRPLHALEFSGLQLPPFFRGGG